MHRGDNQVRSIAASSARRPVPLVAQPPLTGAASSRTCPPQRTPAQVSVNGGAALRSSTHRHALQRAQLKRLDDEAAKAEQTERYFSELLKGFRHRSVLAEEAKLQCRRIKAMVNEASFSPPSDADSSSDDGELREDEISRAKDKVAALGLATEEIDGAVAGIVVATAMAERQASRDLRRAATGRAKAAGLQILYGDPVEAIEDESEAQEHADELVDAVARYEEARNIQAMVHRFVVMERPVPPDFDSTALTSELDQLVKQASEVIAATETVLRLVMDPSGKSFQTNIFDGELARLQYHQAVCDEWLDVASAHAAKYTRGAQAVTDGVSSEVAYIRKAVLEIKEECDLLMRQCERKKMECDVAVRRQESSMLNTMLRQVLVAGWSSRARPSRHGGVSPRQSSGGDAATITVLLPGRLQIGKTAPEVQATASSADFGFLQGSLIPTPSEVLGGSTPLGRKHACANAPVIPPRYLRPAAQRLRQHLTSIQAAIVKKSDVHAVEDDNAALRSVQYILEALKEYEVARRDDDLEVDAGAEMRQQLRLLSSSALSASITEGVDIKHSSAEKIHDDGTAGNSSRTFSLVVQDRTPPQQTPHAMNAPGVDERSEEEDEVDFAADAAADIRQAETIAAFGLNAHEALFAVSAGDQLPDGEIK
jgi:hypothetical protein